MSQELTKKCCICGNKFQGYGHNPEPIITVTDGQRCCDDCNDTVILRRLNDVLDARVNASQEFYLKQKAQ